jgi:gluconolactonase
MPVKGICIFLALAVGSPLIDGEKPVRQADVHAGEGPAWDGKSTLYFTGGGRISRRDSSGKVEVFREGKEAAANGLLFDGEGRLVVCEGGNRRVVRLEKDGRVTVMADRFEGKRFNSPNDLTMDSRGRIYFSDPRYGNRDNMEMAEHVYRIDAPGKVTRVTSGEVDRPNGVLVSAKDEYLFIADNNNSAGGPRKLYRFKIRGDGTIDSASRHMIHDWGGGRGPDGLKADTEGRLYVAAGRTKARPPHETSEAKGGVYIFSPEGKLLETIPIPDDEVTNCAFGGPDKRTLFITAGGNLWRVRLNARGR